VPLQWVSRPDGEGELRVPRLEDGRSSHFTFPASYGASQRDLTATTAGRQPDFRQPPHNVKRHTRLLLTRKGSYLRTGNLPT